MHTYDFCCVGHITLDKVVTPKNTVHMPGGTSFYCSNAIRHFNDVDYILVTLLAESEMSVVQELQSKGIIVEAHTSAHSVYFENIYGENQDNRTQRVLAKADPFVISQLQSVDAKVYLLGALLADDFSADIVKYLATKGQIAIDSQGYLREVREEKVYSVDWPDKRDILKHVTYLKANEVEMEVLTGETDAKKAALQLFEWGVKEVILTFGSLGSLVYDGKNFHRIPAYVPADVVDATGCGDTYMTGYLYQRSKGASIDEAGRFAAAMATIKIESMGPFSGSKDDVLKRIKTAKQIMPEL